MKIIAIIYLAIMIFGKIAEAFLFGVERKPYSPTIWLVGLLLHLPLAWLLYQIIFNY